MKSTPKSSGDLLLAAGWRISRVRKSLIYARGWSEDMICRETTLGAIEIIAGKARRRISGRTDYTLRVRLGNESQPVAVALIEAKKDTLPPGHGLDQAKGYLDASRHNVLFVFSSNGHLFVEFDRTRGMTSAPRPLSEFPSRAELRARYERIMGFSLEAPAAKPLLECYPGGEGQRRYFQDAAIRAVLERIAQSEAAERPARALLSLATGTGKTFIACNLLKRISDAGQLKRALFLCDRDELRTQGLKAMQGLFGNDATEVYEDAEGLNHAKNARVAGSISLTLVSASESATGTNHTGPPLRLTLGWTTTLRSPRSEFARELLGPYTKRAPKRPLRFYRLSADLSAGS
jgi:type I restriction enzyme, R subunit